ncbi:guanylate kinase [Actinomadura sp. 7K534]|uniref:guanylate kinase n=1 Tax=Actinomadura sp. 7K534 TaxID=2530366 RepID=UPI00104EDD59|nr:guanylate kinase [Actinomadura sp. 7K534]TDB97965.1 guanylate kinase [Actinomadura sp. 7K534]
MTGHGVILYGPPASGKDTITAELARQDARYAPLAKLKAGTGRTTGYRHISPVDLDELRAAGRLAVETHRYGNIYAIERDDIAALVEADRVPVVHMGNLPDLQRLRAAIPLDWTTVLLWIPRAVCADRSQHRGDADTPARLQAWDETRHDLHTATGPVFNLIINTNQTDPAEAAQHIITTMATGPGPPVTVPPDLD